MGDPVTSIGGSVNPANPHTGQVKFLAAAGAVTGSPTYSICPCCGVQYGADDQEKTHEELRKIWVQGGAQWWSQNQPPPEGWSADDQLKAAGFGGTSGIAPN